MVVVNDTLTYFVHLKVFTIKVAETSAYIKNCGVMDIW